MARGPECVSAARLPTPPWSAGSAPRKAGTTKTYVVRRGDNLAIIAKRTGITQGRLLAINSLGNPNKIFPGQRLRLAGSSEGG